MLCRVRKHGVRGRIAHIDLPLRAVDAGGHLEVRRGAHVARGGLHPAREGRHQN